MRELFRSDEDLSKYKKACQDLRMHLESVKGELLKMGSKSQMLENHMLENHMRFAKMNCSMIEWLEMFYNNVDAALSGSDAGSNCGSPDSLLRDVGNSKHCMYLYPAATVEQMEKKWGSSSEDDLSNWFLHSKIESVVLPFMRDIEKVIGFVLGDLNGLSSSDNDCTDRFASRIIFFEGKQTNLQELIASLVGKIKIASREDSADADAGAGARRKGAGARRKGAGVAYEGVVYKVEEPEGRIGACSPVRDIDGYRDAVAEENEYQAELYGDGGGGIGMNQGLSGFLGEHHLRDRGGSSGCISQYNQMTSSLLTGSTLKPLSADCTMVPTDPSYLSSNFAGGRW